MAERAGFEPAVLSHTAFRERHHQPLGHLSAGEDTKRRRPAATAPAQPRGDRARRAPRLVAADPADDLDPRGRPACWASWMTDPAAPSRSFGDGEDERLDIALQERPDAHRAGLHVAKIVASREPRGAELAGRLTQGARHGMGGRDRSSPGPDHEPARPSPRRRRPRPRSDARPGSARARLRERLAHEQLVVHGPMLADDHRGHGPRTGTGGRVSPCRNPPRGDRAVG